MEYSTASGSESTQKWPQLSLREAGIDLIDCDHRTPSVCEAGFPYVAIPQLKEGHLDLADARLISADDFEDWTRKAKPQAHDVVLSRRCNPGETAYVPEGKTFAVGQNLVLLRSKGTKVYPPFLRWLTRGPEWWDQIEKYLNYGAVFDSLKCADVPNFTLTIPPLPEQRCIAHILGTLDDTIELNRRMNATLEAMARAHFRSWFVNFDPVRAKAEGREPAGMDAATAALFPDGFEESALGEIPKGWESGSVYEVADVIYGAPFTSALFNDVGMGEPLIRIRDLANESPGVWTPEVHPKGYKIQRGDIVVGMDGEFRAYLWGGEEGWMNQRICVFKSKSGWSAAFVRNAIIEPLAHVEATETATTVIHLGKADIDLFRVVLPSSEVADLFNRTCQPRYDRIVANKQESRTLAVIRDALLPKLISGEVRIPADFGLQGAAS